MQFYKANSSYQRMFPLLNECTTEIGFEEMMTLHVSFLNDLVNEVTTASKNSNYKNIYTARELYFHFFPRLSLASNNKNFTLLLDFVVKKLSEMIDIILKEHIANAYIKIFNDYSNEIYKLEASARIARQEEEAAAEEAAAEEDEAEEETHMDDIINQHYDAVFTFTKNSKQTKCKKSRKERTYRL